MSFANDISLFISNTSTKKLSDMADIEVNKSFNEFCPKHQCWKKYMINRSPHNNSDFTRHKGNGLFNDSIKFPEVHLDIYLTWK